ncbi:hypothetical protein, conserved [Trypanosoma brucei brucei TREU927]|uniref:Uncharacterized protein n=1 Tax=Trypanosoma brucei brucei (strain 927/4 GUTat10.1) TaxID=185431 RepID=Q581Y9_TRYB2|nr:hypothetical protein, conserved [Trypanosoma brucei brucei TREU927]AAX79414.1 hypothetical protein, conserved [Trypanosoma brucei]AAZ12960.1 hypothetical protein, conserved [Trypanosoma brucei brucei TREU927]
MHIYPQLAHFQYFYSMQDYLREIEGRLARKRERQNTVLYRLAKRKADEKRLSSLGIRSLPSSPLETADVNVVKFVIFKTKQEIGDKVARLRNPELVSIETHGEVVVRAKNDEVNQLISKKNLWERRLATLNGETHRRAAPRKIYFGCAAGLPEAKRDDAKEVVAHVENEEDGWESGSHASSNSDDDDDDAPKPSTLYREELASRGSEDLLRCIETEAERNLRSVYSHGSESSPGRSQMAEETFIVDVVLPTEEEFRIKHLERRKQAIQKRLDALKN